MKWCFDRYNFSTRFGIRDSLKADNNLSDVNKEIYKPNEAVKIVGEGYIWLIMSQNYFLTKELLEEIKSLTICEDRICVIFDKYYNRYGKEYKVLSEIEKSMNNEPSFEFIEIIKKKKN